VPRIQRITDHGKSRRCRLSHVISCGTDDQCALMISVAPAMPCVSVHQCLVSVLIRASCQCHINATYQCACQCTSMPHISAHLSCFSVSPISSSQCHLSVLPISATYQFQSVLPISAHQ
ncbi:unnamed protein product, partial [Staurois parvus]